MFRREISRQIRNSVSGAEGLTTSTRNVSKSSNVNFLLRNAKRLSQTADGQGSERDARREDVKPPLPQPEVTSNTPVQDALKQRGQSGFSSLIQESTLSASWQKCIENAHASMFGKKLSRDFSTSRVPSETKSLRDGESSGISDHENRASAGEGKPKVEVSYFKRVNSPLRSIYERSADMHYAQLAEKRGMSLPTYREKVREHLKQLLKNASFWRQDPPEAIKAILESKDRCFKSIFELVEEGHFIPKPDLPEHMSDPLNGRRIAETTFFNYPRDLDPKKRIIYGHLSTDHDYGSVGYHRSTIHLFGGASGGIATKFKKDYIEKSVSILLDDSLCSTDGRTKISALPVPYLHPDESCFPLYKRNLKTGKFEPNDQDPLDIKSLAFIDPYPEFQIHRTINGPVKVDEAVEKFVIRRPHMCSSIVQRLLRESGIPYISDFRGS